MFVLLNPDDSGQVLALCCSFVFTKWMNICVSVLHVFQQVRITLPQQETLLLAGLPHSSTLYARLAGKTRKPGLGPGQILE